MNVLLVSPNIETLPDPVFPLGLAYIAAALRDNHIPYRILDLCFTENYLASIQSAIDDWHPQVIGLSLRNVDNVSYPNYVSYLPFYRQVISVIREKSDATIVIGGSAVALIPDLLLYHMKADFGVIGEGEAAFVKLIKDLGKYADKRSITGPRIISDTSGVFQDLDTISSPERSEFDNQAYLKWGGMGNIQTKRGCPFNCIYCTYAIIEGKRTRMRSPKNICDEIETMLQDGIDNLFFVDNVFNYPIDHAEAVCREIITRQLPVRWSCYANPKFVTRQLVDLMRAAGCTSVEFGSDAAHDAMLGNLGKNFNVDDLRDASVICRESGMSFCHSLLLGGPGETMDTVRETVAVINEMFPTAVICMVGIRVFPHTKLFHVAIEEGVFNPDEDFLKPVFYLSSAIENEILPFIEEFSKKNPTWIFPGMNINMNPGQQRALRRFGLKGPLWEHLKKGRIGRRSYTRG